MTELKKPDDNLVVFYADDDADDRDFFKEAMEEISSDSVLRVHERGDALMEALNNPPPSPNIVFLDLNMPGMTGFEVLRKIREKENLKNVYVVILTTSDDEHTKKASYQFGADYYITKPLTFSALKQSLLKAFESGGFTSN